MKEDIMHGGILHSITCIRIRTVGLGIGNNNKKRCLWKKYGRIKDKIVSS